MAAFVSESWYLYLHPKQQRLVRLAYYLYDREEQLESRLEDYSFIVFPMAKAFEGFIKQYLYDMQLIDQKTYEGKRFRIGRALNPDLSDRYRDEFWLFDDLTQECGRELAQNLWDVWLLCRNRVFHYYPKEKNSLTLEQAQEYLEQLGNSMAEAVSCLDAMPKDATTSRFDTKLKGGRHKIRKELYAS
jgi:hypothetical protein